MDEVESFFCQFPNPWALRVSGMGGYTSKCEKSQNHCTLMYNWLSRIYSRPWHTKSIIGWLGGKFYCKVSILGPKYADTMHQIFHAKNLTVFSLAPGIMSIFMCAAGCVMKTILAVALLLAGALQLTSGTHFHNSTSTQLSKLAQAPWSET
jgi:hypothetical protein